MAPVALPDPACPGVAPPDIPEHHPTFEDEVSAKRYDMRVTLAKGTRLCQLCVIVTH